MEEVLPFHPFRPALEYAMSLPGLAAGPEAQIGNMRLISCSEVT